METKFTFNPIHIVRGLQALLALIALALLAHVAQWFNADGAGTWTPDMVRMVPNEIIFAVFVPVMTLLITLPYVLLTPRYFPHLFASHTKYTVLALESLTMIFWFAAFVSVAAFLNKLSLCRGHVCTTLKVGAAMSFLAWLSWGITSLFALRFCLGMGVSGGKGSDSASGITRGDRVRERVVRGLRLHNVWTGHGRRDEDGASPRSYNVTRSQSQNHSYRGSNYGGYGMQQTQPQHQYRYQAPQPWENKF